MTVSIKLRPLGVFASSTIVCAILASCGGSDQDTVIRLNPNRAPFPLVEATIAGMHAAMKQGQLSCRDVVQGYIARINAYDKEPTAAFPASPALRSVIAINPNALAEADKLDAAFFGTQNLTGPMHCVPVLAKDNFDTFDMKTTAGSLALANNQPPDDAYTIRKIRASGAIILGKANLDEYAFGFVGRSAVGGQAKNAYDPTKGPGGSSSGTGTSIAASFAMVGLGTDTGGSVRVPSALEALIGIRPSLRLVSQDGIVPLAHAQDTAGPMCRTVEDCAVLLDAMVGFDPSAGSGQRAAKAYNAPLFPNAGAYAAATKVPTTYTTSLRADGLRGARIGVVRSMFPAATAANQPFLDALNTALTEMAAAGAVLQDIDIDDRTTVLGYPSLSGYEFKDNLTEYLLSWPSTGDGHPRSYDEVSTLLSTLEPTFVNSFEGYRANGTNKESKPAYLTYTSGERDTVVITRVTKALGNNGGTPFDVLVYPVLQGLNTAVGSSPNSGSNNRLSPYSGFPAMTIVAGFATPVGATTPAQPVGLEILAREFDEPTLFKIGYGWQQTARKRRPPTTTPELMAAPQG
jgi:Asp-tRNA(Asn)/Glu-tRNA(Gln) amidotransferase A subunit family amidase